MKNELIDQILAEIDEVLAEDGKATNGTESSDKNGIDGARDSHAIPGSRLGNPSGPGTRTDARA